MIQQKQLLVIRWGRTFPPFIDTTKLCYDSAGASCLNAVASTLNIGYYYISRHD